MSNSKKPVALAVCTALTGGLLLTGSAFASTQLAQGYLLGADAAAGDKAKDGSCGEGKCGASMDTDKDGKISRTEFAAAHDGKDDKFAAHDTDSDGFVSVDAMKAHMEGKCGEGKCGEGKCGGAKKDDGKKAVEGKCGEGKCGGSM